MCKKSTTEDFVNKSIELHGIEKYSYGEVDYINSKTKVKIFCNNCQIFFEKRPHHHLQGVGCFSCANNRLLSTTAFILKAQELHGLDKYNYDSVNYINNKTKVKIFCNNCQKFFLQQPNSHLSNSGCKSCAFTTMNKKLITNYSEFVERSRKTHGDKFDYSLVDYIDNRTKVKIKCNKCQTIFEQYPYSHYGGRACSTCSNKKKSTTQEFIDICNIRHNHMYDYSKTIYVNDKAKVKIKCKKCQTVFEQRPNNHKRGIGCLHCKDSKGELLIKKWLDENNIDYVQQAKFTNCKNKKELPFDFHISQANQDYLLEFQGIQHYEPSQYFGGAAAFQQRQINDQIKRDFAISHGFNLVEFPYTLSNDAIITLLENLFISAT